MWSYYTKSDIVELLEHHKSAQKALKFRQIDAEKIQTIGVHKTQFGTVNFSPFQWRFDFIVYGYALKHLWSILSFIFVFLKCK